MLHKDVSVKVTIGYQDVAETKDPQVCAKVLALLLEGKPETPEQTLIRELRQKAEDADYRTYEAKERATKLEKQVADLVKKVDELRSSPPLSVPL